MTLRTITFDDSTHKLVPLEPTELMINDGEVFASNATLCYRDMIAAAPEYQEPASKSKNYFLLTKNNSKWEMIQCVNEENKL